MGIVFFGRPITRMQSLKLAHWSTCARQRHAERGMISAIFQQTWHNRGLMQVSVVQFYLHFESEVQIFNNDGCFGPEQPEYWTKSCIVYADG
jgi:hypothetical protein